MNAWRARRVAENHGQRRASGPLAEHHLASPASDLECRRRTELLDAVELLYYACAHLPMLLLEAWALGAVGVELDRRLKHGGGTATCTR